MTTFETRIHDKSKCAAGLKAAAAILEKWGASVECTHEQEIRGFVDRPDYTVIVD
ncbi:hypothetical protein VRRI112168_18685 [Vreelandella rituensis]|uniref:hypothetical protein n=1 Tax=Vreelandella rituensis TaxID=2282306 RepID=UPI0015F0CB22|nr:hypothetical protein [Halomonas rituensis]